jgi:2-succinyl-6-hydroxy-2,4-cyclohexadiene-1-carboxylate synthase
MLPMSYILSADATLYYEEYGTGEPLVLLPGLLGSVESHWRRFMPEYAKHFHTIAVDLRGHGRTNNPSRRLVLSQCVDDLHILLDTLEIERALFCGYSFGGYLALAYAIRHPRKAGGVAVHATRYTWDADTVAAMAEALDPDAAAAKVPDWTAALARDHLPGNGPDGWRDLMLAARPLIRSLAGDGIGADGLGTLACPVLVTRCADDELVTHEEVERLAAAIPGGRSHTFGAGKHPLQSVPKQPFVDATTQFLLSCIPPTAG